MILERIAARRGFLERGREDAEFEAELLVEFVPPLFDEAARRDDENPAGIRPHDELADVETRHDRLAGTGIVGQNKPQRLSGQHRFVDGGDLVGQRIDVRGVDRHHRVEQESEVDPLRFAGQLKGGRVTVEGPGAFGRGLGDRGFVGRAEKPLLHCSVR